MTGGDRGLQRVRRRARRRVASARSSAARPRRISSWSQRARFWSSSRIGSPDGPTRARARDAWISISATQAVHLGLARRELGEDAAETQRVLAQRRSHPVVAGGRRVAFVEDQVDDLEHRRQARGQLGAARHLERNVRLGERALGADDALRDGRLGHEKGARDLVGGQAAEQAQRERDARLGREHRMAGGEDETQQVVADVGSSSVGVEGPASRFPVRLRARGRAPRACVRAACRGAAGRWRGAWRSPSARRPGCPGRPTWATARARRPARPAPAPRRGRRRARCARGRRSVGPTRCARRRRWRDGCR